MRQKVNYNKNNKLNIKLILIIVGIIFLFLVMIVVNMNKNKNENINPNGYDESAAIKTPDKFEDAKSIIEYFDCVYISQRTSSTEGIDKDIYLRFKYDLYEEGKSKESWYTRLIRMLSIKEDYQNLQLIDESKDVTIQIICDVKLQGITKIIINGDDNYFVNHDSKAALENYGNEKLANITINSNILNQVIETNWYKRSVNFGTQESTYDGYDIFFEEGIKVRNISDRIFNIVFTSKYNGEVINGILPTTPKEEVQKILGEPMYQDNVVGMYGYKGDNVYVFFYGEEISVYRVEKSIDTAEFIKIIEEFNNGGTLKEFGSKLTDLWPDYDYYSYDTNYVELSYALRGIKLQYNIDNTNGIVLFNNYIGEIADGVNIKDRKKEGVKALETLYFKNSDLVFETEAKRAQKEYFKYNEKGEDLSEEFGIYSSKNFYVEFTKVDENNTALGPKFISIHKDVPDSELDEHLAVNEYFWYDDNNFVFSTKNKGIYAYNCVTRNLKSIIEGNDVYKLESLEDGVLVYDGKSINISI